MDSYGDGGFSPADVPMDRAYLSSLCGGDAEFERELMEEFLSATPQLMADLERAISEGDWKTIEMCAHTLKGSCRSLGANPMSEPCELLENGARDGCLNDGAAIYRQVADRFETLKEYICTAWNLEAA